MQFVVPDSTQIGNRTEYRNVLWQIILAQFVCPRIHTYRNIRDGFTEDPSRTNYQACLRIRAWYIKYPLIIPTTDSRNLCKLYAGLRLKLWNSIEIPKAPWSSTKVQINLGNLFAQSHYCQKLRAKRSRLVPRSHILTLFDCPVPYIKMRKIKLYWEKKGN